VPYFHQLFIRNLHTEISKSALEFVEIEQPISVAAEAVRGKGPGGREYT
jgi:hypothetical protein